MTAVVGPIGVKHADFGHRRVTLLLALEVILNELEIVEGHGQIQGIVKALKIGFLHRREAVKDCNIGRNRELRNQSLGLRLVGSSRIHGVDAVVYDAFEFGVADFARQNIGRGGTDDGLLGLSKKLYALLRGVGSLVELPRQVLNGEYSLAALKGKLFLINIVNRRLGENRYQSLPVSVLAHALHIVTDKHAHFVKPRQTEIILDLALQFLCANRKRCFLLDIKSSDLTHRISSFYPADAGLLLDHPASAPVSGDIKRLSFRSVYHSFIYK